MPDISIKDDDIAEFLADYNQRLPESSMPLCFDQARLEVLKSWRDVQACPGSGKTTLVAAKLLILEKKVRFSGAGLCVLTHTNVARDEIVSRIECNPSGYRLTQYPNFIGTIQEFVNKFLAIPYLRSIGMNPTRVDNDACITSMAARISYTTRGFLGRKREPLNALLSKLKIDLLTGEPQVPGYTAVSRAPSYMNMTEVLRDRMRRGLYFYSEMYYFAKQCVLENNEVVIALRKRFPIVMIDEMQDTQKYQDDIINSVFLGDDVFLQRFGDPDQAIFDKMDGGIANETFNGNTELVPLNSTHRLPASITSKIHGMSVTGIGQLETLNNTKDDLPHTIFLYTDATQTEVLEKYCDLLDSIDPEGSMMSVKAVGATEGEGKYISAYWPLYDRNRSIRAPRPLLLIDAVRRQWWSFELESSTQYALLIQCILDLLRKSQVIDTEQERFHTSSSLIAFLKKLGKYDEFRGLITSWVTCSIDDEQEWRSNCDLLLSFFDIARDNSSAREYLEYSEDSNETVVASAASSVNVYRAKSGRKVEIATVHSVKGETHDATLVLETKNHQHDLEVLSGKLTLTDDRKITGVRKLQFARQIYVACSRPRKLLCLAAHQDRFSLEARRGLVKNGWRIHLV